MDAPSRHRRQLIGSALALPLVGMPSARAADSQLVVGGLPVTCNLTLPIACKAKAAADGKPKTRETTPKRLARVLARGLASLPLDQEQRQRALALAKDALIPSSGLPPPSGPQSRKKDDVAGLAAAVAYAIVYVDHLPLSQAEVAAPFRVGVGRLRGRFAELRAQLDLIRGDTRYATTRR